MDARGSFYTVCFAGMTEKKARNDGGKTVRAKALRQPANKAHPAIPAQAGIQWIMRALRAPLRCGGRKRKRDSGPCSSQGQAFRRNDGKKAWNGGKKGPEWRKKEAGTVSTQPAAREWRGKDAYWNTF